MSLLSSNQCLSFGGCCRSDRPGGSRRRAILYDLDEQRPREDHASGREAFLAVFLKATLQPHLSLSLFSLPFTSSLVPPFKLRTSLETGTRYLLRAQRTNNLRKRSAIPDTTDGEEGGGGGGGGGGFRARWT